MTDHAVTNSACLIGLERIGRLDILEKSFSEIIVPPAVYEEFGLDLGWLIRRPLSSPETSINLQKQLDIGEAEAIALAIEIQPIAVILDDKKARRVAEGIRLPVVGTVGLLLRAKKLRIINEIRPLIDDLRRGGFRVSDRLVQKALRLASEPDRV